MAALPLLFLAFLSQEPPPVVEPAQEPPASQAPAPEETRPRVDELARARDSLKKAGSYRLEIRARSEGGGQDGSPSRPEGAPPPEPEPVIVEWMEGQPLHLRQGDLEAFKAGEILVYRDETGTWTRYERRGFGGRGEGGRQGRRPPRDAGGEGGAEAGQEPGARAPRGEPGGFDRAAFERRRRLAALASLRTPDQLLEDLAGLVASVERTRDGNAHLYRGVLTEEGALKLSGAGRFRRRGGESRATGEFEIAVDPDGVMQRIRIRTTWSGSFGDRNFERTRETSIRVSGLGSTSYEVPEEVRALLEAPGPGEEF